MYLHGQSLKTQVDGGKSGYTVLTVWYISKIKPHGTVIPWGCYRCTNTQANSTHNSGCFLGVRSTGVISRALNVSWDIFLKKKKKLRNQKQTWQKTQMLFIGGDKEYACFTIFVFHFLNSSNENSPSCQATLVNRGLDSTVAMSAVPGKRNWELRQRER